MAKKPTLHSYSDRAAFERLMLLIATIAQYPGVGCPTGIGEESEHHNALQGLKEALEHMAQTMGVAILDYSLFTLRQDLATLRRYGILGKQMYRWGYYLGTGATTKEELAMALQALAAQSVFQGDGQVRQVYQRLARRLRSLNLECEGQLFYPVRSQLNRAIVHTDPEEMMQMGQYRKTLFHQLEALEQAIAKGQSIKIYRRRDPYGTMGIGALQVYPLQMIYADIAWYLLSEVVATGHFEIERVDRFSDELKIINAQGRGIDFQRASLEQAHQLLENGWGLYLGNFDEQQQERNSQLELVSVVVRFFSPISTFIMEGERRHPHQKIYQEAKGAYLDYFIDLPPRSLDEFCRWVYRFMHYAQILAPIELAEQHRQAAMSLVQRFQNKE